MRIKVSDYIAQFLYDNGITDCFTVVGGGAMHLNDSFGNHSGIRCTYNHHEQASAIAAEAYYRINNKLALCCVTTGPGGTNAITGVVGAWLDSIPMLVISGQVRYDTTARSTGLPIRSLGDQEFDICKAVSCMTKYCTMVTEPLSIKYHLQKALYLAKQGRPGPSWLDIPLNVQGAYIDTDDITEEFKPDDSMFAASDGDIDAIISKLKTSERPVIIAGSAVRTSGAYKDFSELIGKMGVPVTTCWNSIDLIEDDNPLYVGRGGIMGDRAGNFAVQNADFVLALGSRLSIRQVGYNYKTWAREAFVAAVDIDGAELKKPTVHIDLPICADVKSVIGRLSAKITSPLSDYSKWVNTCIQWKNDYPVVQKKHFDDTDKANVYAFIKTLSSSLPKDAVTVVGNGSACVVGSQAYVIKNRSRFIINSAIASMGYDLPAAIGTARAADSDIICISGDGSIQMNLQELQTIKTNKLPVKIFVINNSGYHSIRQTQSNLFESRFVGIGQESGDLEFPPLEKLAAAYGYDYLSCNSNTQLGEFVNRTLSHSGSVIAEVFVGTKQNFEPKSSAKKLPDGTLVSPPLEDMAPFLPDDEMDRIMIIPRINND
ncbi:MAG: thiamine pyrophosphate-binding protein [Ruminococcaceae bacterium]|nr:thiamine pyrophosphate-binding protein [Oscillospiraceae bacterium]